MEDAKLAEEKEPNKLATIIVTLNVETGNLAVAGNISDLLLSLKMLCAAGHFLVNNDAEKKKVVGEPAPSADMPPLTVH